MRVSRSVDWFLDKSVVLGYSRIGPTLRRAWWPPDAEQGALVGRHVVVTGASSGLGTAAAAGLARLGARVHLVGRDEARLERAAATVRAEAGAESELSVEVCDVSDLDAVRAYAADLCSRVEHLHGLVHNAGVLPPERRESAQGHELVLATHVLGPCLLTHLLRRLLAADGDARVVWVSSGGMYTRALDTHDLQATQGKWSGTDAYARTKRMQVVLAQMWAERLRSDHVAVHAMHPGWADTPGVAASLPRFHTLTRPILRTAEQGADTMVWLASAPGGSASAGASGVFWSDRRPRPLAYAPWQKETPGERARLWGAVSGLIGVDTT